MFFSAFCELQPEARRLETSYWQSERNQQNSHNGQASYYPGLIQQEPAVQMTIKFNKNRSKSRKVQNNNFGKSYSGHKNEEFSHDSFQDLSIMTKNPEINPHQNQIQKPQAGTMNSNKSFKDARLALQNYLLRPSTEPIFHHEIEEPNGRKHQVTFNNQYYIDLDPLPLKDEKKVFTSENDLRAYNKAVLKAHRHTLLSPGGQYDVSLHESSNKNSEQKNEHIRGAGRYSGSKLPEEYYDQYHQYSVGNYHSLYSSKDQTESPSQRYLGKEISVPYVEDSLEMSRGYLDIDSKMHKDNFYVDYDYDEDSFRTHPKNTFPSIFNDYSDLSYHYDYSDKTLDNHLKKLKYNIEDKLKEIGVLGYVRKPCFTVTRREEYRDYLSSYSTKKIVCP